MSVVNKKRKAHASQLGSNGWEKPHFLQLVKEKEKIRAGTENCKGRTLGKF
jgi:hypothetical protein